MKTFPDARVNGPVHRSAADHARQRRAAQAFDGGPAGSARDAAQRQRIASAFGAPAQRATPDEEEMKPAQRQADSGGARAAAAAAAAPNRTGMPDGLKQGVEALSGMDLSDVRVHSGSSRPAQLDALAYAQGNDIHLAPGQHQHLPHEAWHVVQQRQGRVPPTMQLAGVAINDDAGLEAEADAMGARALEAQRGRE